MSKVLIKARVQVLVEVVLDQPWDEDATGTQVYQQAKRWGLQVVEHAMRSRSNLSIVGEPLVTMVLVEEKTT